MIFKSDLIEAINDLNHDLLALSIRVNELENKMKTYDKKTKKNHLTKKEEDCLEKAIRAVAQPRTKDGKFAKKK